MATFSDLAAGFGIGVATAWRYVNEIVELLAARAPKLRKAVRDARKAGHASCLRHTAIRQPSPAGRNLRR